MSFIVDFLFALKQHALEINQQEQSARSVNTRLPGKVLGEDVDCDRSYEQNNADPE
jgi:hypothetical protein